jgi:hypothetical protein
MYQLPDEWLAPLTPTNETSYFCCENLIPKPTEYKFFDYNNKPKKEEPVESPYKTLHDKWVKVLEEESKTKNPLFKSDPNISQEFFDKLADIAKRLNINPEDLASVIFLESHFDPQARNNTNKYHGLIQMDRDTTFKSIFPNENFEKYKKLSREKQLEFVEKYLQFRIDEKHLTGQKISGGQLRTLIKSPAKINNPTFVNKQQDIIDSIKQKPAKYSQSENVLDKNT